ncbi:MAG: DUF3465 domain-containing protein [Pseudomonadota bacterium]
MRVNRRAAIRLTVLAVGAVIAAFIAEYETGTPRRAESPKQWTQALDDKWVATAVTIYRELPDDNEGSRHQRLLGRTDDGHSLLIVHNIDLAPRVPARAGDRIEVRGHFVWNDKGGLVHWTHHDPQGRHDGGYIDFDGKRYR